MKSSVIKTSWNSGEWSPLLNGHIDVERFASSSRLLRNLIALKQGPIVRRGGTKFVKEVKDSADNTVLIPFEFNVEQEYQIEAGDQYFRFYTSNAAITESSKSITGITTASPAVFTINAHGYNDGNEVYLTGVTGQTSLNNKFYRIANKTTNTFELTDIDGNAINVTTASSGGTTARVYEIASPYPKADLINTDETLKFQYAQSADVLYIAHGDYKTRSVARSGNTDWSVNTMDFNDGPYLPINDTTTTFSISSGTLTASSTTGINNGDGFLSTDVGRVIRIIDGSNWKWGVISAVSSTTQCTVTNGTLASHTVSSTTEWRLGMFSDTTGWPTVITFFQDRVFLAGAASFPDRWALTRTGGYSDTNFFFAPSDEDGTVTDDAGITGTLQSGKVNTIQWAGTDDKGLVIGTAAREWIIRPSTSGEVLTPDNAKADAFSAIGSSYVQPVQAESGTIFAQRARRKLMDIIYSFERDQLKPRDLTILCEHITKSGIAEMKFQQEPINTLWMRLTNGKLIGFTYYPDEQVFAAHSHVIGGEDVKVKSISVIPSADTSRDELWMIVERTIDGVTRKYIEYMTRYYEDDINLEDAICVDSALTYDGSATSTISGLEHLEGETVKIMVDGKSHPDLTVSNGSVTLANDVTGSVVQIGIGYSWAWKSQNLESGSRDGTSQGKIKRIMHFGLRVLNTLGLYYGVSETDYDEYDFDQGKEYNETPELLTGDITNLPWPNGYETDGTVYLWHDGVFPATILAVMPQLVTEDRL